MRILHTGDWHLGKNLGTFSRLPEQVEFIDELVEITRQHACDMVLVTGDVFDTHNPPAEAEQLFYQALHKLTHARAEQGPHPLPVVVIAGNHDNPTRLSASAPIAAPCGALITGLPSGVVPTGDYGGFCVIEAGEGYFEIAVGGERAVVAMVPYPGERRLNSLFNDTQQSYSDKVGQLIDGLTAHFKEEAVNLLVGHFYITGGTWSKDSERPLMVGGAYAVDGDKLPNNAQYIAMGHLHRPQSVAGRDNAYYAGSPIQYAVSETGYAKCVMRVDAQPGLPAAVEKIYLRNYKPIEQWKAGSIEEAAEMAEAHANDQCWAYLEIQTERPLTASELKRIRSAKRDIVEILPMLSAVDHPTCEAERDRSPGEMFSAFYREKRNAPPSDALVSLFMKLTEGSA